MRLTRRAIFASLLVMGCMLGPNFEPPTPTVPATWRDTSRAIRDSSYANLKWWDVLEDTTLQRLVRDALGQNRDLRIALARVNEARAQLGIQRYESYPEIDIKAGQRRANGADSSLSGSGQLSVVYLEATIAWEADLWGRVRRLDEAAIATLLASEEERRGVIITVVSEVARAYLELRDLDAQVLIADTQIDIRRQSLGVARARFQGGLTSELDVRQGEAALAIAEGVQARARRRRVQKENELSVLLGRPPEDLPRGLPLSRQPFDDVIPAGLPSELLRRRPDIRRAEQLLRAANARIGAAIAAMFPSLTLTGALGTVSDELTGLFQTGTGFWRVGTSLLLPAINKERNAEQVALERARTEEALGQYEKTVLTAFREVEDGLVAVRLFHEEAQAAARTVAAARQAVALAGLRYGGGVDNYLSLLDSQREELNAELLASELQAQQRIAVVQLYKALGGGWDTITDSLAMPPGKSPPPRPQ